MNWRTNRDVINSCNGNDTFSALARLRIGDALFTPTKAIISLNPAAATVVLPGPALHIRSIRVTASSSSALVGLRTLSDEDDAPSTDGAVPVLDGDGMITALTLDGAIDELVVVYMPAPAESMEGKYP